MGWFWSKTPLPLKDESRSPQPPTPENPPTPPQPQSQSLTREDKADAEFKQLWASLQNDINQAASSTLEESSSTSTQFPNDLQTQPASIAPESLYPDTMSCRSAFDYAFFCQSLGGQFVNVYRYGELRSCSEHWENFWLCMKTRTYSEKEKRRIIRDHYRKKAIKYKTGPSSEDVWEVRMEPVRNAFQGDFAALEREMKEQEESQARAEARAAQTPMQRAATSI
ncbi:EMI1 family protein [Aspergillus lucknowensis]|uniref:Early meiotic induction protein 1 n=1 Tax=Aspergillus lucknowensis TaxID=176173 RepID=A0ABR4LGC5_9EURO